MAQDIITYLNDDSTNPAMFSRLVEAVRTSKQARASAAQWIATIEGMVQKGIKPAEMKETGVLTWLNTLSGKEMVTREQLVREARSRYFTLKEVALAHPEYSSYRQPDGHYQEILYVLNSERDNLDDALELINFDLEEVYFNPHLIMEDPERVLKLEKRRESLMTKRPTAQSFPWPHFRATEDRHGKHGNNLMAHCRISIRGHIYFVEELQSDWAQRGRKNNWTHVPKGPLVSDTELWAGAVMRRQLQRAALTPGITHFAWITESMRNGGRQSLDKERLDHEKAKAFWAFVNDWKRDKLAAVDRTKISDEDFGALEKSLTDAAKAEARKAGLEKPHDMLNDFYLVSLPKIMDKVLAKTGEKVARQTLKLGERTAMASYGSSPVNEPNVVQVPTINVTDKVRDAMSMAQPVYSRANLLQGPIDLDERSRAMARALQGAKEMLGSSSHIKIHNHVYDVASGRKVAGSYLNRVIHVSLRATDVEEVMDHECLHFAVDNLMRPDEVDLLREKFAPGEELNFRVRQRLVGTQEFEAATQCNDPLEAAAHAFSLWRAGKLDITERRVDGIFSEVANAVTDATRWLRRVVLGEKIVTVEDLFRSLAAGELAQRQVIQMEARDLSQADRLVAQREQELGPIERPAVERMRA